ncbi:MAG TPA: DedA family protein [Candidatus Paceibacterota bacterium]
MSPELIAFLESYGYFAIFVIVFLTELGIPTIIPIEFVLLFSGYLVSAGSFDFLSVLLAAMAADFAGTAVLFSIFYFFGHAILERKPKWLPIGSREQIKKVDRLIAKRGRFGIYLARLIPYVRAYTSPVAGLVQIKPKIYLSIVVFSSFTWIFGFLLGGRLLGPEWEKVASNFSDIRNSILAIVGLLILFFVARHFSKKHK